MMMRQGGPNNNNNKRPRGRGNGGGGSYNGGGQQRRPGGGNGSPNRMQTFDSNGPDVRIRGNAYQVHEKYVALARDASVAGDRVLVESYYQHAEHYYRIINAENYGPNGERRQNAEPFRQDGQEGGNQEDYQEGESQGEGGEQGYREERAENYRENRPDNRSDNRQERGDNYRNNRGDRQPRDGQNGERPYQDRQNLAELPQPDLVTGDLQIADVAPAGEEAAPQEATVERRRRHPRQVMPEEAPQDTDEQPEV